MGISNFGIRLLALLSIGMMTSCGGSTCPDNPPKNPIIDELKAQWVSSDVRFQNTVASGDAFPEVAHLPLDTAHPPASVALGISARLTQPSNSAVASEPSSWRLSLFPAAYACTLSPLYLDNSIQSITVTVAASENSSWSPGEDASTLFTVSASQKANIQNVLLAEWNMGDEFLYPWLAVYQSESALLLLTFTEPETMSAGSAAFAVQVTLEDGQILNTTTDVITLAN